MKTSRTTRGEWQKHVRAWKLSGISSREYASKAGINANTLTWWRWRLDKEKSRPRVGRRKPPAIQFVEVSPPSPDVSVSGGGKLELELAGVVLRLPPDFDAGALTRALGVLEARR